MAPGGKQSSWAPAYHDDVVSREVCGQLSDIAPVCGLIVRDDNVSGPDLHGLYIRRHVWSGDLSLQKLHALQPRMQA